VRLQLTLKCSTEEQARLIGAALQEQWRRVGIQLELRPLELATLFSDVAKGNFQITYQRWVGANTDPDFFEYAFSSKRFPPEGANRGHYRNPRIDALTDQIRVEMNQGKEKFYAVKCKTFWRMIFLTCPCGSTTSFPSTAARSALSIFPPRQLQFPRDTSCGRKLRPCTAKLATTAALFQSPPRESRLPADPPGVAIQFHDCRSQRPARFSGVQHERHPRSELLHYLFAFEHDGNRKCWRSSP